MSNNCIYCNGTGEKWNGSDYIACFTCKGAGMQTDVQEKLVLNINTNKMESIDNYRGIGDIKDIKSINPVSDYYLVVEYKDYSFKKYEYNFYSECYICID